MASKYDDDDPAYADSKYSDDAGSESKFSGDGGGGGGGAEAKGSGGADAGAVLPPIVQAFAHHVMSKKFRDAAEAFFRENCAMFRGVDPKAEQLLEYTDVYQKYVAMVELSLESFCAGHHVTSEELFGEVQEVVQHGELDDEFLPAILRVAEYTYFMEQMVLTADHKDHLRDAFDQAANGGGGGGKTVEPYEDELRTLTGAWRVDKKRTAFDALDMYLAAIRVPAVFRGLAKGSFYSNKELVVLQGPAAITIVTSSPFGLQRLAYPLDGQQHDASNPWGAQVPVRCTLDARARDGVEVVVEQTKPSNLPPGSRVVHSWCGVDGGKALRCTMEVACPGRAAVRFDLYYAPVTETDLAPKKKGPSSFPAAADAKNVPCDAAAQAK